jgi:hypothetical protein
MMTAIIAGWGDEGPSSPVEMPAWQAVPLIASPASDLCCCATFCLMQAKRDLPLLNMTPTAKTLAKAVNAGVQADGCTALLDGLTLGLQEHSTDAAAAAAAASADGGKRRVRSVFLCTDGLPNVG